VTLCEQCRRAAATVHLSWQSRCATRAKLLCDACARAPNLPAPFTLRPLPPGRGKK